ncbi:MAG: UbiH/UbiF family hydroxylase [Azoarcus sp.]|jgi:ubiquinone biosynthesis UbiH/UbiF/VisC/COQ6 family hydroxylase|nr:UbiH/UbiF family hydroxylase [Azoarcus sp.]
MNEKFDLIIIGGGLAGATLAVALRGSRLAVALIDSAISAPGPVKPAGWDTRIYAYTPASARFLQTLGVWDRLDHDRLCAVERMQVHGDGGGRLDFEARDSGCAELAWIGESAPLLRELWESLTRQHNVTVFAPAMPKAFTRRDDSVDIILKDGRILSAALVVGADGRDSWLRQAAGIGTHGHLYDQQAIVANLRVTTPHQKIARQWFRADGVLAWLPLPGERISLVWSAPDDIAATLMALPDDEFCQQAAEAGGKALGDFAIETPRAAFALRFMRAESIVAPRLALVGDAAHAIHPLSGHGINLGFQDVRALAGLLGATGSWEDIGDYALLRRYARARAEEPLLLQYTTDGLARLFACHDPLIAKLRNAGLNLTARLPVAARLLARYAANGTV